MLIAIALAAVQPAATAPEPVPGRHPRPARVRAGLTDVGDYPLAAMRAEAQGDVTVRYVVGADGTVSACRVLVSSGNADLDATSCLIPTRRFLFDPARDASGHPVAETRRQTFHWRLPEPEPDEPAGD